MPKNTEERIIDLPYTTGARRAGGGTSSGGGGGASSFLGLSDTPSSYAGKALYALRVNAATNALEFVLLDTDDVAEGSNLYFTNERAQDAVGSILTDSASIDLAYDDAVGTITAALIDEYVQDLVAAMFAGGTHTDITVTYDDTDGTLDLAVTGGGGGFTQEEIEDFIGAILADGNGVNLTYDDVTPSIIAALTTLTSDWDLGEDRAILAEALRARDAEGLSLYDDGGNLAIYVKDGGFVGLQNNAPAYNLHIVQKTGTGKGLLLAGKEQYQEANGSDSDGVLLVAGVNRTNGNRQLWVIPSDYLGSSTNGGYRLYAGVGIVHMGGIAGDGVAELPIVINQNGGPVGIGGDFSATAALGVQEPTVGNVVMRLQSTATNDDPNRDFIQGRVATTNATVTTINTIPIPNNTCVMIDAKFLARRTGGSSGTSNAMGGGYAIGWYRNNGGTVTLIVGGTVTQGSTDGWPGMTLTISGTNVLVQVQGMVNNNITWHSQIEVSSVSS